MGGNDSPGRMLMQIWNTVKAASAETQEGLNIRQFSMALRLVALAQMGEDLLDERARAAMEPHVWQARGHPPLPTPRLSGARCDFALTPCENTSFLSQMHDMPDVTWGRRESNFRVCWSQIRRRCNALIGCCGNVGMQGAV